VEKEVVSGQWPVVSEKQKLSSAYSLFLLTTGH
jgi:hypothetical protein